MFKHASVLAIVAAMGAGWAADARAQTAPDAADVSEVVVTGSRIARDGYAMPTPVTVANMEQLQAATPSNIPDALNKLPSFVGSRTQATVLNGSSPSAGNYLNLRAFGVPRTLILLDGRRVPATSFDGTVDTNTLPQLLVQRVEVVTGGASAVYGSDAVTGVVNFILDRKFDGLKGVVQGGVSDENDGKSWRAGLAGGMDVLDRGHFIWSAEHYQSDGLKYKEDRPYGSRVFVESGAGTAANPFRLLENTRVSNTSYGGLVLNGPFAGRQFLPGGALGTFNPGTPSGTAGLASGGDGAYLVGGTLLAKLRTDQIFGRFEYEISDNISAYAQVSWAEARTIHKFSVEQHAPNLVPITIFSGNAFLRPEVQALLTAANAPSFNLARYAALDMPKSENDSLTTAVSATFGLTGKAFDAWTWDLYYTHGEGRVRQVTRYNTNTPRFYAAVDAVRDPSGNIVCRVTLTNPGLYPGCVPLNLFGVGAPSQAAMDYIFGTTQFQVINRTDDLAFNVAGEPFSTWAGPVSFAFGGEYRRNSLDESTNASPADLPNFTGLRGGFTSTTQLWRTNVVAASEGSNHVWELNAETVVPLLRDLPFAKAVDVNGAIRYTRYSTSGGATTWKVGLNYVPFDDLRFRATRSRDIRAPSLFDLFGGRQVSPTGLTDVHTSSTGLTQQISGGNPNLVPEVADTTTVGLVYAPSWLPRFTVSVDYFDISIDNGLAAVAGTSAAIQAECEASGGSSPLCTLLVRPLPFSDRSAANFPTAVLSSNLNVAQTYTHGLDVEASYSIDLADVGGGLSGNLDLRLLATYQPTLKVRNFASAPVLNTAGAAPLSDTRLSFLGHYANGPLSVDVQTRYIAGMKQSRSPTLVYADPDVPSVTYTDISFEYRFDVDGHPLRAFLSVSNVFDKQPPIFAEPATASIPGLRYPVPGQTDIMGRYFTSGVRFTF